MNTTEFGELHRLAEQVGAALKARGWMLSSAESCTGGQPIVKHQLLWLP